MQDQRIIELIRTDQSDRALNALYNHFPIIRKMIRKQGGSLADAEDIFQDALIILIRRIENGPFTLTARLSTYLYSVCRYLWKDECQKRRREIPHDFETGLTPAEEQAIHDTAGEENRVKLAVRVLDQLQDRCRELLLLFYEGRMRLREIAEKMGYSSESTAKNQKYKCLEYAKLKLREMKSYA
jgi:RNA polymerase sigma factor (sigma-70 family)